MTIIHKNFAYALTFFICIFCNHSYAETTRHDFHAGTVFLNLEELTLDFKLDLGWGIYSYEQQAVGRPFKITITDTKNIATFKPIWPTAVEVANNKYYRDEFTIDLNITPHNPQKPASGMINLDFVMCKNFCAPQHVTIPLKNVNLDYNKASKNSYLIYVIALIGGVILNFMPCVLPVILLKFKHIIDHAKQGRTAFLYNAVGIIFSFFIFAQLIYFLKIAGHNVGMGFAFQNSFFITTITIITFLLSYHLLHENGLFQSLPFASKLDSSNLGHFASGAFMAVMASPCTAPFVSTATAYAITQDYFALTSIYLTLAAGLASPFLLFYFIPQAIAILPKPGYWMVIFKKIIGTILLLTSFWLIYILGIQQGVTSALLFTMLLLLLKFALEHGECSSKKVDHQVAIASSNDRACQKFAIILIISLCFIIPYNVYLIDQQETQKIEKEWHSFSLKKLDKFRKDHKTIIVDITADWCLTCKLNKFIVLNSDYFIEFAKKNQIILMRADLTNGTNDEIHLYMTQFHRHGIPMNVLYNLTNCKNGCLLPELLKFKDIHRAF